MLEHVEGLTDRVEAIKRYALAHYETGGWDFLVETYDDNEIVELLESLQLTSNDSLDVCLVKIGEIMSIHDEKRLNQQFS